MQRLILFKINNGSIEELSDLKVRKIYDLNVFGVLNLLKNSKLIDEYSTQSFIEMFNKYSPHSKSDPEKVAELLIKLPTITK
ncbi:hypothetical protein DDB_G0280629 [Dictyostelium discoideum AX4]|uniref:Uncharacterized protein n=1 Tax=Dictyostelium discoideum TaxID=44689 RepID=Q54V43_DICDI|nr:hypothetical protein DDB_G0280629 [Dictyostelium discoideum AX4]EAL67116.1 hypothetical protein DDB_G0280629 [Dictyostelium discoideum AX4]|eukprot:XP_641088.1 hypothetical protein DDB_G0280629 [Dictyostelium discoideum AX4]